METGTEVNQHPGIPIVVKMATTPAVIPQFLQALRLKKREDPIPPALHSDVEGDTKTHVTHKTQKGVE